MVHKLKNHEISDITVDSSRHNRIFKMASLVPTQVKVNGKSTERTQHVRIKSFIKTAVLKQS
jgi:hypothetical protein